MLENSPCTTPDKNTITINQKATTHLKDTLHRFNIYANLGLSAMDSCMKFFFITPDEGGKDAFVHITAVQRAGLQGLDEGQKIQFELIEGRNGRMSAEELAIL